MFIATMDQDHGVVQSDRQDSHVAYIGSPSFLERTAEARS